jgi:hypothetical protein
MRYLISLFFLSLVLPVLSQVHPQLGARSNALGNSSLCLDDVWSVYNNPGAFGLLKKTSLGVAAENRFLMKELSSQSIAFGFHREKSGNFGIQFQQYGYNLYREMNGGLVYGMKLFDNFSAGVSLNYHGIFLAENYGSKHTVSAGLGLLYSATKNLKVGMRVQNITRTRLLNLNDERLPTNFGLGFLYQISKKALWSVEAEKDLIHPINFKSGLEIQAHEIFAVRLGVNSYPFTTSFGFGLKLKNFHFDAAAQWHTTLGISPSFGLHYSFN